jgi:putative SOS response-associated peptidase YedK
MCGRFAQIEPLSNIIKTFLVEEVFSELKPSYNIAPGSRILSVIKKDGKRLLIDLEWGLIPHWAKEASVGRTLINARAESVFQKPSFRNAVKSRRCLIVASGFYEWKKEGRIKTPYYITHSSGVSISFAGLYEIWISKENIEHRTCAIITTEPNGIMKEIHNRMPVILTRDGEDAWLDTSIQPDKAQSLLAPYPNDDLLIYPVSALVNSPKNDSPECIIPRTSSE